MTSPARCGNKPSTRAQSVEARFFPRDFDCRTYGLKIAEIERQPCQVAGGCDLSDRIFSLGLIAAAKQDPCAADGITFLGFGCDRVDAGDVVDVTLFVVDPESNLDAIWSILPEYWGEAPYPTLTGIGVTWLYGFKFEIKVIARLP
ncbi:RutC family protein YjgH [compost metagenome]|nr:RutC family protein yjgH [Serratia plymuthica]